MTEQSLAEPADLHRLLRYEQNSGKLYWLKRPVEMFANARSAGTWNGRYAGKLAIDKLTSKGYRSGTLHGRTVSAHRIIWALAYGEWPECIDHLNGSRSDNRLGNLRSVSYAQNSRNRRVNKNSTTGVSGVKAAPKGRWAAHIRVDRKFIYLGAFDTVEEAAAARRAAEVEHGFLSNKGELAGE